MASEDAGVSVSWSKLVQQLAPKLTAKGPDVEANHVLVLSFARHALLKILEAPPLNKDSELATPIALHTQQAGHARHRFTVRGKR